MMSNLTSRVENILISTIDGTEYTASTYSRVEDLLLELKEVIEAGGGGGGGGTTNYNLLTNKPKINGVELKSDKEFEDLGLEPITSEKLSEMWNN